MCAEHVLNFANTYPRRRCRIETQSICPPEKPADVGPSHAVALSQLVLLGYELIEAGAALEAVACNNVEAALMWLARNHVPFGVRPTPTLSLRVERTSAPSSCRVVSPERASLCSAMQTHRLNLALPAPAAPQAFVTPPASVATAPTSALPQQRALLPQMLPKMTVGGAAMPSPAQSFNIYGGTGARANQV